MHTGIYIARGDDTLGPYEPDEAARLIESGILFPEDTAARDGDADWVPLSTLVPANVAVPSFDKRPISATSEVRRPGRRTVFWLLALLLAAGLTLITFEFRSGRRDLPRQGTIAAAKPTAAVVPKERAPALAPRPVVPVVKEVAAPTPFVKTARLNGVVSLKRPDGSTATFADVRVSVYPLDEVAPMFAQKKAQVQIELDRLAPKIAAAEAEKAARMEVARAAQQAFLDPAATDELRGSLRFALDEANAGVNTAKADDKYLADKRREAMDGDFYFRDLPAPLVATQTDADGGFALELPSAGQFAVAAAAHAGTLDGPQVHYWLLRVSLKDGERKKVSLTEENVASADSADSLLQTAN